MTPLLTDKLYLGNQALDRVYLGTAKVWPSAPTEPTPAALVDDFNSGVLDPTVWNFVNGVSIVNGQAVLPADPNYSELWAVNPVDMTGRRCFVEFVDAGAVSQCDEYPLALSRDSPFRGTGDIYWWYGGPGNALPGLNAYVDPSGMNFSVPYDPVAMRWLAIRESGGVVYFEYSADGQAWIVLGSGDLPFNVTAMYFSAWNGGSTPAGLNMTLDNVDAVPTAWTPASLPGLAVWFDASQLGLANGADVTPWPNLASSSLPGGIVGSPPPKLIANGKNALPVVRFASGAGRVRIAGGSGVTTDWTLAYVAHLTGPIAGRIVNGIYPPNNILYGWWNGNQDVAYDNGFMVPSTQTAWTTDWKLYSADATGSNSRLLSDGVELGSWTGAQGWGGTFCISGYAASTDEETCDCEVAEVCFYNRKLSDADRQALEAYLHNKWFVPHLDPATQTYLNATGLDPSYAPALDALVTGLKQHGLWSKMVAVYPMIGGTAALHKWNLVDPRDVDAAYRLTFNGGTHSLALGYRPNAQGGAVGGGYADTQLVPSSVLSDVNSTHLAYYSLADVPPDDRCEMGCYNWSGGGSRFHIIARYNGGLFYYGMSEDGATNASVPASSGLFATTRTAPDATSAYRNGVQVGTSTSPPTNGLPNFSVWLGGIDAYRGRSDLPCGFASIGSGLTAQNVADLYTVVQAFQAALGRQI